MISRVGVAVKPPSKFPHDPSPDICALSRTTSGSVYSMFHAVQQESAEFNSHPAPPFQNFAITLPTAENDASISSSDIQVLARNVSLISIDSEEH